MGWGSFFIDVSSLGILWNYSWIKKLNVLFVKSFGVRKTWGQASAFPRKILCGRDLETGCLKLPVSTVCWKPRLRIGRAEPSLTFWDGRKTWHDEIDQNTESCHSQGLSSKEWFFIPQRPSLLREENKLPTEVKTLECISEVQRLKHKVTQTDHFVGW